MVLRAAATRDRGLRRRARSPGAAAGPREGAGLGSGARPSARGEARGRGRDRLRFPSSAPHTAPPAGSFLFRLGHWVRQGVHQRQAAANGVLSQLYHQGVEIDALVRLEVRSVPSRSSHALLAINQVVGL